MMYTDDNWEYDVHINNGVFSFADIHGNPLKLEQIVTKMVYKRYGKIKLHKGKVKFKYYQDAYSDGFHLKFRMTSGLICDYNIKNLIMRYSKPTIKSFHAQLQLIEEALVAHDERIRVESNSYRIKNEPSKAEIGIIPNFQIEIMKEYDKKYDALSYKYELLRQQQHKFEEILYKINTTDIQVKAELEEIK